MNISKKITIKNGKNYSGKITVRHKGGGLKIRTFYVCYHKFNNTTNICINNQIFFDKKHNAFITKKNIKVNNINIHIYEIITHNTINLIIKKSHNYVNNKNPTNFLKIKIGTTICLVQTNLSIKNLIRSAGCTGFLIHKSINGSATILLPSTKIKKISILNEANIGTVSNIYHSKQRLGKAGLKRQINIRPTVRGVAINPVDHPNGGRTRGGKNFKTPYGKTVKK